MHLADHQARPIEIAKGEGCYLFDRDGKRYLDFIAGWCVANAGYQRREIIVGVEKQVARGLFVPAFLRYRGWEEFARLLSGIAPNKKLTRAWRCTSGSEAVEFAIKCARAATGRKTIVSVDGVYHGHTYGAASVGEACTDDMSPCLPGFLKIPMPDSRRGPSAAAVLAELEKIFKENDGVAAFLSEPVWTNAGSIIPPKDFYPSVQKLCRQYKALLIMDEVATGFGRCGSLFGSELWGLQPDILCLGKGLTGGYGTMGATLVTEEIFQGSTNIPSYSTFGWAANDLAAAQANVELILKEKLWENAARVGEYLRQKMRPLEDLPFVGEVRGIGLLLGIEIVRDKSTFTPDYRTAAQLQNMCAKEGLLLETAGSALFITPPLILTKEQADEGVKILEQVLK